MNYINRALVKQQAKDIIRGKVFYLFLVSIIVSLLVSMSAGFNVVNYNYNFNNNDFELFKDNKGGYQDFYDYYDDFGDDNDDFDFDNPIEDFEFDGASSAPEITQLSAAGAGTTNAMLGGLINRGLSGLSFLVGVIFAPLTVTLAGMYLSLVRRKPEEPFDLGKELGGIFKNSFNDTYLKKLLVVVLRNVFIGLLSILLFVPGIIFYYSSYFTSEIMSDNPNLKPTEAIKLSKKMVQGNRTELFVLELSFIPWILLLMVTFGIASVYVIPYISTTKALYYENFRMRALQSGKITIDDFKSFDEKVAGFTAANGSNAYGYTAPTAGSNAYYYTPPQNGNSQPAGGYYYQPTENVQNQPPQDTAAAPSSSDAVTTAQNENTAETHTDSSVDENVAVDMSAEQTEEIPADNTSVQPTDTTETDSSDE